MIDVRSVVERRQIADQPESTNRSPAHVFDETVIDLGLRGDQHSATGEFAVTERQKQAGAAIHVFFSIDATRKLASTKTHERQKNSALVTAIPQAAVSPLTHGA